MTKQDFLNGESFYLNGDYSKTTTYKICHKGSSLEREYRMTKDLSNVLISDHIFNIEKIGTKKVHLYTFLLGKKIKDSIRYDDMLNVIDLHPFITTKV
tara:strand:- start:146 stop:439 length:294 start_codon:yes stop_codon:yes gene_type:complete